MLQVIHEKDAGSDLQNVKLRTDNHANPALSTLGIKRVIIILGVFSLMLASVKWSISREKKNLLRLSDPAAVPVTLIEEVEHLPAPSCKAIPLSLPTNGNVSVQMRVLRGDLFDIFVIAPDQLEPILKGEWKHVKYVGGFAAIKTDSYQHTAQLAKGGYYLVVMDRMISMPSSFPSNVSVKVQFK